MSNDILDDLGEEKKNQSSPFKRGMDISFKLIFAFVCIGFGLQVVTGLIQILL